MNIIRNLPGPLLIFLGALSLSFGGLIVNPLRVQHILANFILEILIFFFNSVNFFDYYL